MKNRDRYILHRNEYDLMLDIEKNTGICPIRTVAGISKEEKIMRCFGYVHDGCEVCVQEWLNEEENMNINGKWFNEPEIKAYINKLENILRDARPVLKAAIFVNYKDTNKANEIYDRITEVVGRSEKDA